MPVIKVKGGYKVVNVKTVHPTKEAAIKQNIAIAISKQKRGK